MGRQEVLYFQCLGALSTTTKAHNLQRLLVRF